MSRRGPLILLVLLLLGVPTSSDAQTGLWTDTIPAPDNAIYYMSAFPTGEAFVFFHVRPDSLYVSRDFGLTWETRPGPPGGASGLEMASPRIGYVTSGENIHRTDDGGASWDRMPRAKLPGRRYRPFETDYKGWDLALDAVGVGDESERVTFGGEMTHVTHEVRQGNGNRCYWGPRSAVILTTDDGSKSGSYRITKLGFPGTVGRTGWLNSKVGWALATEFEARANDPCTRDSVRTVVLITRDAGKSYHEVYECPCMSVAMSSSKQIVVGQSDGWVFTSNNGGRSFEPAQYLGPPGGDGIHLWWVNGIEFANRRTGYAVVTGGGTWRTDDGGQHWDFEPSSQTVWGPAFGDIAVFDQDHAVAGGARAVSSRL